MRRSIGLAKAWKPETTKIIVMNRKAKKQWRVSLRQRQTKVVFHPKRIIGRFEIAKCYIVRGERACARI